LVQGDLTSDVSNTAQRIISEAVGVWGRLDVLINNASQFYATPIGSVMEREWEDLVRANLTSPFFLSQVKLSFRRDLLHQLFGLIHTDMTHIEKTSGLRPCFLWQIIVPELSFLLAPYRGSTRVGERRVQDNLHAHAQCEPIKNY